MPAVLPACDYSCFAVGSGLDWLGAALIGFAVISVGIAVAWLWPLRALRALIWLVTHTLYRVEIAGKRLDLRLRELKEVLA